MKSTASIVIDRPINEVFAFVETIANFDHWVAGMADTHMTSEGDFGVGSTYRSTYTSQGQTSTIDFEVTAYEPPQHLSVQATEGPFPFQGRIELETAGEGTRLHNTIDAGSDSFITTIIFALGGPLIRRMMRKQLYGELETLKTLLES